MSRKLLLIILTIAIILHFCSDDKQILNPYNSKYNPEKWQPTKLELIPINIHSVELQWEQKEENFDGFMVDKKHGNTGWMNAFDTMDYRTRKYIDTSAVPGQELLYNIYAYADNNKSKTQTKTITLNFPAPTELIAEQNSISAVNLNWKDNSDGEDGFRIDRKVENGDWINGFGYTEENAWADTIISPKQKYYYQVSAFYGEYFSDKIDTNITCEFPCPENLTIQQKSDISIRLDWDESIDGEEGFIIDRKVDNGSWELEYANLEENTLSWDDNSPIYGKTNTYRLYAYYGTQKSSSLTIELKNIIPLPQNFQTEYEKSGILLSWEISCDFITGFVVQKQTNGSNFIDFAEIDKNSFSFKDTDIKQDQEYRYRLCAKTTNNESDWIESGIIDTQNREPNAFFSISPEFGFSNTTFTFDASESSDIEDINDSLQVRWDFNHDGIWDTEYSTNKIATHQYNEIDTFKVTLAIKDTEDKVSKLTKSVIAANTPPIVSLVISPTTGSTITFFTFDVSNSYDIEDAVYELQVRWDFENDGIWDADYSTVKDINHRYSSPGTYELLLEVRDTHGGTTQLLRTLTVSDNNSIPNKMIFINGGDFTMGDILENSTSTFQVTLDDYYMSNLAVSIEDFLIFLNDIDVIVEGGGKVKYHDNIILYSAVDSYPFIYQNNEFVFAIYVYGHLESNLCPIGVSWFGAVEYCNWLSDKDGYTKVYEIDKDSVKCNWNNNGYRLPTEAEWEFASRSRGRNDRKWSGTNSEDNLIDFAWYQQNSNEKYHNVGTRNCNDIGIYDLTGNMDEWCWDKYDVYPTEPKINPTGGVSGIIRTHRGGRYWYNADFCSNFKRNWKYPESDFFAIRLVRRDNIPNSTPTASFIISPESGTTETEFTFDASECSDAEDATSDLQVRWDFENDGTWDTDFSTIKTTTHKFSSIGEYTIKLEVLDTYGDTASTTIDVKIDNPNTLPSASFTISPESGTTATEFTFDASECSDAEDATSDLQVRWDFENDGTWDTNFSTIKTTTHTFSSAGDFSVKMEVIDTDGATDQTTISLSVDEASNNEIETGTVTDVDGNVYKTVKIGDQWWMAENLKVTHYQNGESIENITDATEWSNLDNSETGAYCVYNNDVNNTDKHGNLYNWYAVKDPRKIAPEGWHIPSDDEFKQLEIFIGMNNNDASNIGNRGTDEGYKLKAQSGWNNDGNGSDKYSFSLLPTGVINYEGIFRDQGKNSYIWTASISTEGRAWDRQIYYYSSASGRYENDARNGFSVRCIKGDSDSENTVPSPSFTISPESGSTETEFTFDASECSDAEDATSDLQVRWDFENDGTWDTDYSTIKTTTHTFSSAGDYSIKMEVLDTYGDTASTTIDVKIDNPNTLPSASFTISPKSGSTETEFTFDASSCSDAEDATSDLQVRWDFENDGIWDTDYSTTKTTTHTYSSADEYTINMEVIDTDGATTQTTESVKVTKSIIVETGTMTDIDGNVYKTVKIGDQWWMAENLKVTHYRSGQIISNEMNDVIWNAIGSYCSVNGDETLDDTYGYLYNWYAIKNKYNIAPEGWHVPTYEEFSELKNYLNSNGYSGIAGTVLKSASGWKNDGNGTDDFEFNVKPAGTYSGRYSYFGQSADFWTSSIYSSSAARVRCLNDFSSLIAESNFSLYIGCSIRCIKGEMTTALNTVPTASFTISPESGTTETEFTFDASSSTDSEDATDDLQVRWDIGYDKIWDNNYTTSKTTTSTFNTAGDYKIALEIVDTQGAISTIVKTITVNNPNTLPSASFTISPESGTTETEFTFDASGCSDAEDATSDLQVRWDFDNDSIWDTEYSATKSATHTYSSEGEYTIKMEVIDTDGATDNMTKTVSVFTSSSVIIISNYLFDNNTLDQTGMNNGSVIGTINYGLNRFNDNNSSLLLNGNGHIKVLKNESMEPKNYSISVWVNTSDIETDEYQTIYAKNDGWNAGFRLLYRTELNTSDDNYGKFLFQFSDLSANQHNLYSTKTFKNLNEWIHIVVTFEASQKIKLYINGQLDSDITAPSGWSASNSLDFTVGRRSEEAYKGYFWGLIDDLKYYSGVLSPYEIQQLYNENN